MNCGEIRSVTSSVFLHCLFGFCRRSPQLILPLYYVFIAAISRGRYLHQRGQVSRTLANHPGTARFGQHKRVPRTDPDQRNQIHGLGVMRPRDSRATTPAIPKRWATTRDLGPVLVSLRGARIFGICRVGAILVDVG